MSTKKDLLLLLLDVGEHMQPYLPLLHRLVFGVLTCKLLSKPNHEVAVVLYGTKGTRHKLYTPEDESYPHVTVLRPLQNVGSHVDLQPFTFATDPPPAAAAPAAGDAAPAEAEAADVEAAAAAMLARMEAAGAACGGAAADAAAAVGRAASLFGPPGPKADWADGLVVALDLLATALAERFGKGQPEAGKAGAVRLLLVSNLLAESEPLDDDFRADLVSNMTARGIRMDVACLDHYVHPQQPAASDGGVAAAGAAAPGGVAGGAEYLSLLPEALVGSRRRNLEGLHLLKSELGPGSFSHLRQPGELLCLFRAKEVALQASNALFRLTPGPAPGEDTDSVPPALTIGVKLYKKVRRTHVDEFKSVLEVPGAAGTAAAAAAAGGDDGGGDGDGDGGGGGGGSDLGFVREVEYEDPTSGEKFPREEVVKGYLYGRQAVPLESYLRDFLEADAEQLRLLKEKDLSLLGFVDAAAVPRSRMVDEPQVMVGDSPASAAAIAALALALRERGQAGVVRFLLRSDHPRLAALTPHLSASPDTPHCLLLAPLPFAEDVRQHPFATFASEQEARELPARLAEARGEEPPPPPQSAAEPGSIPSQAEGAGRGRAVFGSGSGSGGPSQLSPLGELLLGTAGGAGGGGAGAGVGAAAEPVLRFQRLQPDEEQQAAALELVRALDLGPSDPRVAHDPAAPAPASEPHGEALAPEASANPALHRTYALVASRALDAGAQLPHPDDDPLVELLLTPHGRYWPPGAQQALRRAEAALQTRERPELAGPAAKRHRREAGEEAAEERAEGAEADGTAAGGAGAAAGAAAAPVLFDPSAAGGTSGRVTRVSELSPVEDFRAMLAQGGDSVPEAVSQLGRLVVELVGRSIGEQLYDKAAQCVAALRAGCMATGRAGAFNSFLRDTAEWCGRQDRGSFLSRLLAQGVSLISTEEVARQRAAHPAQEAAAASQPGGGGAVLAFADDGGAVAPEEAAAFVQRHTGAQGREAAGAQAGAGASVVAAVPQDEEFEDMD